MVHFERSVDNLPSYVAPFLALWRSAVRWHRIIWYHFLRCFNWLYLQQVLIHKGKGVDTFWLYLPRQSTSFIQIFYSRMLKKAHASKKRTPPPATNMISFLTTRLLGLPKSSAVSVGMASIFFITFFECTYGMRAIFFHCNQQLGAVAVLVVTPVTDYVGHQHQLIGLFK